MSPPPDIIVGVFDIIIFYLHPLPCFFPFFPIFLALLGSVQVLYKHVSGGGGSDNRYGVGDRGMERQKDLNS